MDKYNDKFYEFFGIEDFHGDEDMMERARILFNQLMENFGSNTNMIDYENLFKFENGEYNKINFPILEDDVENLDKMIEKFNLEISEIKIDRVKSSNLYTVSEIWMSEETGMTMDQKYILNTSIFTTKEYKIQKLLIENLIKENLFNKEIEEEYMILLKNEDRKEMYNCLLNNSIELEDYESAAHYRDKIKDL
jgi:hypothetical protein